MLGIDEVYKQILKLTSDIIEAGLCDDQNYPSKKGDKRGESSIGINTSQDNSICLKNISYSEMYNELYKTKNYNLKMIDGALISLLYRFQDNQVVTHRLSFFPAPNLEHFQNEPELYMEDELYLEIYDKRTVIVPLRFDFDSSESFIPVEHPKSHLTLGQYKNCRIPVSSALSPYQFISFIIRNFYYTQFIYCNLTCFSEKFSKE